MPASLPYVPSYGKIKPLFEKIASAKVPEAFTQAYLADTLGLTSSGDRPLIPLLRSLGLIDSAGKPSADYPSLKNSSLAPLTVAKATRHAFSPLFAAHENAHTLSGDTLKGLVAQVAGADDEITKRITGTFRTLVEIAGQAAFSASAAAGTTTIEEGTSQGAAEVPPAALSATSVSGASSHGMRPEFHYNIQIHLPSNGSEETYLNIFNALRRSLT